MESDCSLQRSFTRCPDCGQPVLTRLWVMTEDKRPGHWNYLAQAVSPVFGTEHHCEERADE